MLKSVVWFITWNCQNHCPYCWERQRQSRGELTLEPFIESSRWTEAWNRIAKNNHHEDITLDITGGEPFLQPDFVGMLEGLHDDIHIAITTNLKASIVPFIQKISPAKVFSMTISYHPSEMTFDQFIGKALLLKRKGFQLTVNFVAWPEYMYLIPKIKRLIEAEDIRFHVDPYSQTPYVPYSFDGAEKAFLGQFVDNDRIIVARGIRPVVCSGGMNHLVVMPTGEAYRCVTDKIDGATSIGNILDIEGFVLNDRKTPCRDYNRCAGCDRDKVKVENV